jgi:excisionase family DNA binding protein
MSHPTLERDPVATTEQERPLLDEIEHFLKGQRNLKAKLTGPNGEEVLLPESLFHVLRQAVEVLSKHNAVYIVAVHKQLTTNEAAELLNVSRPYLIGLLDAGKIPFTRTGTHRRIKFGDLMAYREAHHEERRQKLARLTQMSQELGLYS